MKTRMQQVRLECSPLPCTRGMVQTMVTEPRPLGSGIGKPTEAQPLPNGRGSVAQRSFERHSRRRAFTIIEVTVALAVVAVVSVIVAQALVWSMRERARLATKQAALELAANILEGARAEPFDKLDKTWADSQTIPSDMADLLPEGKVAVIVVPLAKEGVKRVTVEVHWQFTTSVPGQSVQLTSVFSARSAKKGGTP